MFRVYLKTAWRNIFRNKTTTLINLFGLSVALAAFVFIALWVHNELSFDDYHNGAKDTYLVQMKYAPNGESNPITPLPLGEALKKVPDLEFVARMSKWTGTLDVSGNLFDESAGVAVDSDWFNIFDYCVLTGDIRSFNKNPFSIIFTQSRAKQLFGNRNPIGQVIKLDTTLYEVRAVVKDNPINSSLQFDMLVPMAARLAFRKRDVGNWTNASYRTFITVHPQVNRSSFARDASSLIEKILGNKDYSVVLQPLHDLHFDTDSPDPAFRRGSHTAVWVFSFLAILLLLSASINYVNLTISEANVRTKEISIRKIIGGSPMQLFQQFLTESFLLCLIALALSFCLMWLTLPLFDRITETNFQLSGGSGVLWVVFTATLIVTTMLNGVLPATTVAFFKPLHFLHGSKILNFTNLVFRKGLVVFQFAIGITFIIVTIVIFRQMKLAQDSAAQYNRDQLVSFYLPSRVLQKIGNDQQKMNLFSQTFENDLGSESCIQGIVFASSSVEGSMNSGGVPDWYWPGMDTSLKASVTNIALEPGAKNIFNLQIKEGRWFREDKSDERNFILNETAVRELGVREPVIGRTFGRVGDDTGRIVGIIKDYNFSSLYNPIEPLVISNYEGAFRPEFFIKIAPGDIHKAMDIIASAWKKNIPEAPFEYQFMNEAFHNLYKADLKISTLVLLFSCISIIISALGLFSLAAFVVEQRKKEIGIRKIMGAAVARITLMLSGEFLTLVLIALVIASPAGFWVINKWLNHFTYKIEIGWSIFAITGLMVLLIALITVSFHAVRAAVANPVKALRND